MQGATTDERIWFEDPRGVFSDDRIAHFLPQRHTPFAEQLNALLRLSLYSAVLLLLFRRYAAAVWVPLGTGALTYMLFVADRARGTEDARSLEAMGEAATREGGACTVPTRSNPFMNVLMSEYVDRPDRAPACRMDAVRAQGRAEELFEDNLFRDVDDVFQRRTSSHPFYTTANTQIPNDQGAFARWCYATGPTCKERNGQQCFKNVSTALPNDVAGTFA